MNRSKLISIQILAIVLVQIFTVAAFAATAGWPAWYKQPGTTFQEWSFGDGSVTPPPDSGVMNSYGTPTCWIGGRAIYNKDLTAWGLNTDEMDIFIPNNPALQAKKEMQIEVDWMAGPGFLPQRPLLSVFPVYADGRVVSPDISILEPATPIPGSNLFKTVFWVDIEPNPMNEWVILKGSIFVDHIAIATRCIPEPATFGLLIGGAFMAIRRKGKVQK